MHYKLLAIAGSKIESRPMIWITEFDDKNAAREAADWLVENGSFRCAVVPDPEEHEQVVAVDSCDEIADDVVVTLARES